MVTLARCSVLALAAWMVSGCSEKAARTELILVADTNIANVTRIRFDITRGDRSESAETTALDAGPASVGVVQESEDEGPITVKASAYRGSATEAVAERMAIVSFVPHETRVVVLHLADRCLNVNCLGDRTCTEQGCAAPELSSDDLLPWTGTAPTLDSTAAAPSDAGVDASSDDASADAGHGDASPAQDAGLFTDCGANARRVDLQNNADHCGMCSNACKATAKNTVPTCSMGQCEVACRILYGNCDDDWANGCEQTLSDDNHCGGCNMQCMNNTACTRLGLCR
jgi:hypothetical protein